MRYDKQQMRGSAEGYGCKPTVGKLHYLLLLVLVESLGTSGYAFICHKSKILSPFQLLDKFCMENIY